MPERVVRKCCAISPARSSRERTNLKMVKRCGSAKALSTFSGVERPLLISGTISQVPGEAFNRTFTPGYDAGLGGDCNS